MKTFKHGDYVRLENEKIPKIIELLRINGWHAEEGTWDSCAIWYNYSNVLKPINNPGVNVAINELSIHDFLITALRLKEGDGMRSDMSTPDQRKHIAHVLEMVGVNCHKETFPALVESYGFNLGVICDFWCLHDEFISHVSYSEWCRRLNVEPISIEQSKIGNSSIIERGPFINYLPDTEKTIHNYQMSYEESARAIHLHLKEFCDESLFYPNMIADASRKASEEIERLRNKQIITIPDGTTVDLTKPIEVRTDDSDWIDFFDCYVGFDKNSGCHVVSNANSMNSFKHIRNKPEPEFKSGEKVWYKHEIIENWEFGIIDNDSDVSYPVSGVKVKGDITIRPAIVDGNPVYPPFND